MGCWWGVVGVAAGQNINADSLQKRILRAKSVALDTTAMTQPLKDSLQKLPKNNSLLPAKKHSPRKAAYYSLALPGLGQMYNKQYWKVPIVYAGFGAVVYFINFNGVRYRDFVGPYVDSFDPVTGKQLRQEASVYVRSQGQNRTLTIDQITRAKDQYRRWRDLNYMLLAGAWAINIIEANVAAHLKTFDMSDDISLRLEPDAYANPFTGNVIGTKVVFAFK